MYFTAFTFTKPSHWIYCCGYLHSTREGTGICIQIFGWKIWSEEIIREMLAKSEMMIIKWNLKNRVWCCGLYLCK